MGAAGVLIANELLIGSDGEVSEEVGDVVGCLFEILALSRCSRQFLDKILIKYLSNVAAEFAFYCGGQTDIARKTNPDQVVYFTEFMNDAFGVADKILKNLRLGKMYKTEAEIREKIELA